MEQIYLNKEELDIVQGMNGEFMKMKNRIADIEMEKFDAMAQMERMRFEFANYEKTLVEKYGEDAIINVKTGEVTKKEAKPTMEIFKN